MGSETVKSYYGIGGPDCGDRIDTYVDRDGNLVVEVFEWSGHEDGYEQRWQITLGNSTPDDYAEFLFGLLQAHPADARGAVIDELQALHEIASKSYFVLVIVAGVNTITSIHKTYEGAVTELIEQARLRVDGFTGYTTEQLDAYLEKMENEMVLVEFYYEINENGISK